MTKRLYRSQSDAMLGGVCGGLGDYFDIDANLIRLVFIVLSAVGGTGVVTYLALWLIVPQEGERAERKLGETIQEGADEIAEKARSIGREVRSAAGKGQHEVGLIFGALLVIVGIVFLLRNLGVFWMRWIGFDVPWPILIIAAGVVLFWRRLHTGDRDE